MQPPDVHSTRDCYLRSATFGICPSHIEKNFSDGVSEIAMRTFAKRQLDFSGSAGSKIALVPEMQNRMLRQAYNKRQNQRWTPYSNCSNVSMSSTPVSKAALLMRP